MIQTGAQHQQAIQQIQSLWQAIESLRRDIFPFNPRNFAILAEGPLDQIHQLQADVEDYLSRIAATPIATPR